MEAKKKKKMREGWSEVELKGRLKRVGFEALPVVRMASCKGW